LLKGAWSGSCTTLYILYFAAPIIFLERVLFSMTSNDPYLHQTIQIWCVDLY